LTEAVVLNFSPRKKAAPPPRYDVVKMGVFDSMSCWQTREQAEIAAEDLAERFPEDEIAILVSGGVRCRSTERKN
jgi:hypothetical protein